MKLTHLDPEDKKNENQKISYSRSLIVYVHRTLDLDDGSSITCYTG